MSEALVAVARARLAGLAESCDVILCNVYGALHDANGLFADAVEASSRARAPTGRSVDRGRVLGVGDSVAFDVMGAISSGFRALWIAGGPQPLAVPRPPGDAPPARPR